MEYNSGLPILINSITTINFNSKVVKKREMSLKVRYMDVPSVTLELPNDIIWNINSAVVISVVVESSRCSSKTLQKGSCPYAPLDEALR